MSSVIEKQKIIFKKKMFPFIMENMYLKPTILFGWHVNIHNHVVLA